MYLKMLLLYVSFGFILFSCLSDVTSAAGLAPTGNGTGSAHPDIRGYPLTLSVCATLLFLTTSLFELITEKLEEVTHDKDHFKHMLSVVFKELTVLGCLAFAIFVFRNLGILDDVSNGLANVLNEEASGYVTLEVFEWMHMLIFGFAMFIIVIGIMLVLIQIRSAHRWKSFEILTLPGAQNTLNNAMGRLNESGFGFSYFRIRFAVSRYRNQLQYVTLKEGIIHRYGLNQDFPFADYLKYCMHETTIDLLRFSPLIPVIMIASYWLYTIFFIIMESAHITYFDKNTLGESLMLFLVGVCLNLCSLIMWAKCSLIAKKVAKNDLLRIASTTPKGSEAFTDHNNLESLKAEYKRYKKGKGRQVDRKAKGANLYWFNNPNLVRPVLQVIFWWIAIYAGTALYACVWSKMYWYWYVLYSLLIAVNVFVTIPFMLGSYVKGAYTGDLVSKRLMVKSLTKQVKNRGVETLPSNVTDSLKTIQKLDHIELEPFKNSSSSTDDEEDSHYVKMT